LSTAGPSSTSAALLGRVVIQVQPKDGVKLLESTLPRVDNTERKRVEELILKISASSVRPETR
jgi:hypothetical protein